jgi:hypothetical protein
MTTETITWQTRSGKAASVTVALVTSEVVSADGHEVEVARCRIDTIAEVEGLGRVGDSISRTVPEAARAMVPDAAALCGKLVIPAAVMVEIDAAIERMHQMPEWQAKLEREQHARREGAKYEAGRDRMRGVMGY